MNAQSFAARTTRTTAYLSRRASLIGLGGAALGAVTAPATARAKKAAKKVKRKCRKQIGLCETSVADFCASLESIEPEDCEAALLPCCASFQGCQAGGAYGCIGEALIALDQTLSR
jgi:hypothetical protein